MELCACVDYTRRLPALLGNAGFYCVQRFCFSEECRQLVAFAVVSLGHIGAFGGFGDNGILDGHILLFGLDIVGRECYI
jgi:hypothetical protein